MISLILANTVISSVVNGSCKIAFMGYTYIHKRSSLIIWVYLVPLLEIIFFQTSLCRWNNYRHLGILSVVKVTNLPAYYWSTDATFGLPWYVKTYWILYNITIPVAFLITVFYWGILRTCKLKAFYLLTFLTCKISINIGSARHSC